MKLLIMCEGANEKEIIDILLENDRLSFTADDLLGLVPYHARQIRTSAQVKTNLNIYTGNDIKVLRIGDTQGDKLTIPNEYKERIVDIEKYCTKPELEMLLIISAGLADEFEKVKSKTTPKNFAKKYITCGRRKYDNTSQFFRNYYGDDCDALANAIREYKRRKGSHSKDEYYLADLLK